LVIYFLPTIIAMNREHMSKGAIFALNLILGWTLVGWLFAFIWSLTGNTKRNFMLLQPAKPVEPVKVAKPVEPIAKLRFFPAFADRRRAQIAAA